MKRFLLKQLSDLFKNTGNHLYVELNLNKYYKYNKCFCVIVCKNNFFAPQKEYVFSYFNNSKLRAQLGYV